MGDSLHWLAQRAATVALTVLIAMLVPNTVLLVSVTGAVAAAISGFVRQGTGACIESACGRRGHLQLIAGARSAAFAGEQTCR